MREFERLLKSARTSPALQRVVEQVTSIHEALRLGKEPGVPQTKHGESRIKHVIKFDLACAYRLVLWRHQGVQVPLFLGSHDDVDRWCDRFRGSDFVFSKDSVAQEAALEFRAVRNLSSAVNDMAEAADSSPIPHEQACPLSALDNSLLGALGLSDEDATELKTEMTTDLSLAARFCLTDREGAGNAGSWTG